MRFLFTADWQCDFENLSLCEQAAEDVLRICEEKKLWGFCIAGDLKRQYNPVDVRVTKFWMSFIERATSQHDLQVVVVLGNHDRIGMYADAQNWLPILRSAGATVVHSDPRPVLLSDSEGRATGSCALFCLPFNSSVDETKKWSAGLAIQRRQYRYVKEAVLVFHNDIRGCSYNVLKQQSGAKLQVSDLKPDNYDACFGGHVHLQQHLGHNVYYTGSPFCSDWGEANQKKVYWVYEGNSFYTVPSSIPGWYDPSWPRFPKEKTDWKGTRVRIHVPIAVGQNYAAALEKSKLEAERRYAGATIYTVPEFQEGETGKITVKLTDADADKITAYVDETLPDELARHRKASIAYLSYKLNKVSSNLRTGGRIQFLSAKGQRFLSFRELEIDYRQPGLYLILGKNKDWLNRSNGSGKTNYLSPVPVALFGKTFKEQKHDAWALSRSKKPAWISVKVKDAEGRVLKVLRGRRPGKLQLFIDGKERSSGMQSTSQAGTQGTIEKLLGFTWQTLANAVYIDQQQVNSFLTGTPAEQKKVLERFQNLERFSKALEEITQDVNKQYSALVDAEEEKSICLAEMRGIKEALGEEQKPVELDACRAKYESAKKAFVEIKKDAAVALPALKKKAANVTKRIENAAENAESIRRQKDDLTVQLRVVESKLESVKRVIGKPICPTCLQDVDQEHLQDHVAKWAKEQNALLGKIQKLSKLILEYQDEKRGWNYRANKIEDVQNHYKDQMHDAEDNKDICYTQFIQAQKWWAEEKEKRAKLERKVRDLRRNAKFWTRQLDILTEEKAMLDYCARAFSRNGLPAFLNAQICPQLNAAAEHYSEVFTDKEIQVRFQMKESEFEVEVVNAHGGATVLDQSAGEKKIAAIIACFALRSIAPPCNLLVLDEPGDGLDPVNAKAFASGLRRMKHESGTVLLTSHNPVIVGELSGESCIIVEKEGGVSRVA